MRVSEGRRSFFEKKEPKKLLISVGVEGSRFGRSTAGDIWEVFVSFFQRKSAFFLVAARKAWMPACAGMTGEGGGDFGGSGGLRMGETHPPGSVA
jgi:hypothetical protein